MKPRHRSAHRLAVPYLGLALVVAACTGAPTTPGPTTPGPATPGPATPGPATPGPATPGPATPGPATPGPATPGPATPGAASVDFLGNVTSIVPFIAQNEGFYEGIDVNVLKVGFGEQNALFATGDYPLTGQAPWEVAHAVSQGDDNLAFVSTAYGVFAEDPLIIRKSDEGTFPTIQDLEGKKLGIPGFGEGTWGALSTILKQLYDIDASTYFEVVEADSAVLLALLERGEIDAALSSLANADPEKFTSLFTLNGYWQEQTGHPLLIVGFAARWDWLNANPEHVQPVIDGLDAATIWMRDNTDALLEPPYREWLEDAGWLDTPGQTADFVDRVRAGTYFATSELYTQEWIDNQYEFIKAGEGLLLDEAPPKESMFYPPPE